MTVAGMMVAGALALSACGAASSPGAQQAVGGAAGPGAAAEGGSALPAVDVVDVTSGETVALASLLPADKPTLLWMWAPF